MNVIYIFTKRGYAVPRKISDNERLRSGEMVLVPQAEVSLEARAALWKVEQIHLSERDSLRVMELLEDSPAPTKRLKRAAMMGYRLA